MSNLPYDNAFLTHPVVTIGKLRLPSGQIVACDPYFCADAVPFARKVAPGNYDVQLCMTDVSGFGQRVALARILFAPLETAAVFEDAVKESSDSSTYFVDSGVGSFMDETTRLAFSRVFVEFYRDHPAGNYYTDVLAAEFKRSALDPRNPNDHGKWNLHQLPNSDLNVAMSASGLGDGFYDSYWGVSRAGLATSLVTDFRIL